PMLACRAQDGRLRRLMQHRLRAAVAAVAPGIALTFETTTRPANLEDHLRDSVIDMAIDRISVELDPFVNWKLFDDQLVLMARADHPSIKGRATLEGPAKIGVRSSAHSPLSTPPTRPPTNLRHPTF